MTTIAIVYAMGFAAYLGYLVRTGMWQLARGEKPASLVLLVIYALLWPLMMPFLVGSMLADHRHG